VAPGPIAAVLKMALTIRRDSPGGSRHTASDAVDQQPLLLSLPALLLSVSGQQ
jgi:hypothetical protein